MRKLLALSSVIRVKQTRGRRNRAGSFSIQPVLLAFLLGSAALGTSPALAWYDHTTLMPWVMNSLEAELLKNPNHPYTRGKNLDLASRDPYRVLGDYRTLAELLLLNPKARLPSANAGNLRQLVTLAADEPDHGMDKDLPDSADPRDERQWMGGSTGATSQGFRHMYFAGWDWTRPIATFQIPPHPVGQSLDRFDLLAGEAKSKLKEGNLAWGLRILGWSLHYLQDMAQPFHTNQVPSIQMLPLKALIHWPLEEAWPNFKQEAQRTLENYHWAYEGYVRHLLQQGQQSPLNYCLTEKSPTLLVSTPRELIEEVVQGSRKRSARLGSALVDFFGPELKAAEVSLPENRGRPDYPALQISPEKSESREVIHQLTCESLALAKAASLWMLKWGFH